MINLLESSLEEFASNDVELEIQTEVEIDQIKKQGFPSYLLNRLFELGSETRRVNCPNNEPRFILKNPTKAFALFKEDYSAKVDATAKIIDKVDITAGVDLKKTIQILFNNLNQYNGLVQQQYQAAYQFFHGAPCNDENLKELRNIIKEINKGGRALLLAQGQLAAAQNDPAALKEVVDNLSTLLEKWFSEI